MDEFLKSKSMITPGAAGGITMILTASISQQFGLPGNWTALCLSLLIGLLLAWVADKATATPVGVRVILCVLNSLIIFAVATGGNTVGVSVTGPKPGGLGKLETAVERPFFREWFVSR